MSISGARPAFDIDLEEYEKRLRAAGAPAAGVEDPLAELARLVEASRPKSAAAPRLAAAPPPPTAPRSFDTPRAPSPPPPPAAVDIRDYRPALEEAPEDALSFDSVEEETDDHALPRFGGGSAVSGPEPRRSRRWTFTVSALALAGIVMIGWVFVLKGKAPGFQKEPPFIAAAVGPTKVQPPSDATVSTSDDAGGSLLKDETRSSHVKVVNTEEQPVDLSTQTASQPAAAPAPASQDQPPPDTAQPSSNAPPESPGNPAGSLVRGTVDTPVVIGSAPSPAPSPFPEPKAVRTISLRPDGTPIQAGSVDARAAQAPASEPAQAPRPAAAPDKAAPADAANAQSSTPKIELPTKLSPPKSSARVVVAKTDTTAPAGAAEAAGESEAAVAPAAKPEKPKAKAPAPAPAPVTAEAALPAAAAEPTDAAATSSGGWAVQLAAPRSETEAKAVVAKLNEKYASALGGSSLGVHKASVNGETVYRVRVVGLSKADAAALCARLKGSGGDCFVAK